MGGISVKRTVKWNCGEERSNKQQIRYRERDFYSSSSIIRTIMSRRVRWAGHVARM
jgi:hypothetical protein